ncbi:MAG: HEAT repeat domain-containing protein [Planctomycetota bacterium]|nr:HEAT repeat domain-containing protein [Planctomycetota bacterium]
MRLEIRRLAASCFLAACLAAPLARSAEAPRGEAIDHGGGEEDFNSNRRIDDVVVSLAGQFSKSKQEALDASVKLAQMGRRSVPVLANILASTQNEQVRFYCVYSLSMIRDANAARLLLPLIGDEKADVNMRIMAIGAVGGAELDEGVKPLQALASSDNGDLRFKSLLALSVMIRAWAECEKIFTDGLSDPRDDVRQLCCKVCYQAAAVKIFYRGAEPKLIELAERDSIPGVRGNAIAALARMRSKKCVEMLVRVVTTGDTQSGIGKQALGALQNVTGVPVRDGAAAQTWWDKFGKNEYEKAAWLLPPGAKVGSPDPKSVAAGPEKAEPRNANEPAVPSQPRGGEPKEIPEDKPFSGATMGGE